MNKVSTHVLDTAHGKPAAGVRIQLFDEGSNLLIDTQSNDDGRCDEPLLTDPPAGSYRLLFAIGDYFRSLGVDSPFLETVQVDFKTEANQSYHIPLLCSPFAYSTYRGS